LAGLSVSVVIIFEKIKIRKRGAMLE